MYRVKRVTASPLFVEAPAIDFVCERSVSHSMGLLSSAGALAGELLPSFTLREVHAEREALVAGAFAHARSVLVRILASAEFAMQDEQPSAHHQCCTCQL